MDDYNFILAYKDMKSISDICNDLHIIYTNLVYGKTTKDNEKKVADKLKAEIYKMYAIVKMMEDK